jgi:hypothetical protein
MSPGSGGGGGMAAAAAFYCGMAAGGGGGGSLVGAAPTAPVYAPGSAYSGVSNHSSYLDADLADPRSLTRSQTSDFPLYD